MIKLHYSVDERMDEEEGGCGGGGGCVNLGKLVG